MYALFLETEAAAQIDRYVADKGGDAEAIKQRAYAESLKQRRHYGRGNTEEEASNWWVERCLKDDSHKVIDINACFTWFQSVEGQGYWSNIHTHDD